MSDDEHTIIKEFDRPIPTNIEKLKHHLRGVTQVIGVQHRVPDLFIDLFLYNFIDFPLANSDILNKSNWTHHVYYCIRSTAKTLSLGCTFETMGRMDAVIDLGGDLGAALVAEWESDADSVFGTHKELEKLWTGANQYQYANGFLLTYCPIESLMSFTKKVVQFWQSQSTNRETPPSLYLVVVVTKQEKRSEKFLFIRTIEITCSAVALWYDFGLCDTKEYLEYISSL
jgi:hypothetical protein